MYLKRFLLVLVAVVICVGCESAKPPAEAPKEPVKKTDPGESKGMSATAPPA